MIMLQFSLSTAEDERNYFTGEQEPTYSATTPHPQPGKYRVVEGRLYYVSPTSRGGAPAEDGPG